MNTSSQPRRRVRDGKDGRARAGDLRVTLAGDVRRARAGGRPVRGRPAHPGGSMEDMAISTVVVERLIQAPPGRVWETMTDLAAWESVLSGVERVEVLSPGGFGVGTRWRETRRMFGKEATEEMWVTACEPAERYMVEAESHGTRYISELRLLTAGPETTTVRMSFTAVPPGGVKGLLAKAAGALGARAVRQAITRDLDDVARAVEHGTA